jgi:endoglucanase
MRHALLVVLFVLLTCTFAATSGGCIAPGAQSSKSAALKECGPEGVIDDFEDNNNQSNVIDGRGGYWYTYVDKVGSTIWPEPGEDGGAFTPSEGGYRSRFAGEVKGKIGTAAIVYAGPGINFVDPKELYDASKYGGITFFAKRTANSTGAVRLHLADVSTAPEGGVCSECFNDFGSDLSLTEEWQRFVIPFSDMKQLDNWGSPRRPHIDSSKIFGLQWQIQLQGAAFDFVIDNVAFACRG